MAVYYVNSSAIAKRYISEAGSAWVASIARPGTGNEVYVVRITAVEIASAITRRAKAGTLSPADARYAGASFKSDLRLQYNVVEVTEMLVDRAVSLAETYGLRGYDAVQLAAALEVNALCRTNALPPVVMVSADGELNAAAASEGLVVQNPNSHP